MTVHVTFDVGSARMFLVSCLRHISPATKIYGLPQGDYYSYILYLIVLSALTAILQLINVTTS